MSRLVEGKRKFFCKALSCIVATNRGYAKNYRVMVKGKVPACGYAASSRLYALLSNPHKSFGTGAFFEPGYYLGFKATVVGEFGVLVHE